MGARETIRPLSLPDLEQHLAKAADLLRGSIDQADFKAYIFPLMFFKRISDVYDEEYTDALNEGGGDHAYASFPENHRFGVPHGNRWSDIRQCTQDIGQALTKAFRGIEKANPDSLDGIFGGASWTNKEKLPDAKLRDLIEHFSARTLSNAAVAPDVFGQAYEYLIKRFADQSNKKAGEYYTPRSVVALLVQILDPQDGETVYDPACGTGGMLIEVIEHVRTEGGDARTLSGRLYGQEKVLATSAIARMNLFLHGIDDFHIVRADTLRAPAYFDVGRLRRFDCVIANPPFSLKKWGAEAWSADSWGRHDLGGVPPKGYADWAWVQHMVASASPGSGRVAVVLPQGALFRQGAESRIRRFMLEADLVDTVIGFAPNLFYGTGLAACALILRRNKPEARRGKVLFVNGDTLFRRGRNQNTLEPEHAGALLGAYRAFVETPGIAHVADVNEIKRNDYNLNIPLYVTAADINDHVTLEQALADLETAQIRAAGTRAALEAELAKWGLLT